MNFKEKVENVGKSEMLKCKNDIEIMQINVGKLCNLKCSHCHVMAGPDRKEIMDMDTMISCIDVFRENKFKTIDITGGAPEMNPDFRFLLKEAVKVADKVIVRTNLTILEEEDYRDLPKIFADNKVELFASLPCYCEENTDKMRGEGTYNASIRVLKNLNSLGYGKNDDLVLNLVYNPGGAFLPPPQESLTEAYRKKLSEEHGIVFTNLFAITNNPIGRFGAELRRENKYDDYMKLLEENFNSDTVDNMMCRNQVSIAWNGDIYDCDFNQIIGLKADYDKFNINDVSKLDKRTIEVANHCYACTAGAGSSCGGETA